MKIYTDLKKFDKEPARKGFRAKKGQITQANYIMIDGKKVILMGDCKGR